MRFRLAIHLVVVLLPCAMIALIGSQWLRLDREIRERRGAEAAERQSVEIRTVLVEHLRATAKSVAAVLAAEAKNSPPFAAPPVTAPIVELAALFGQDGATLYPDHERSVGGDLNARAAVLLEQNRSALGERRYQDAVDGAFRILRCCAAERDEYGMAYAVYAAVQVTSASEQSVAALARTLERLIDEGYIGHPRDVADLAAIAARRPFRTDLARLVRKAEVIAARVRESARMTQVLKTWSAGLRNSPFDTGMIRIDGTNRIGCVYHRSGAVLAVAFSTSALAQWVGAVSAGGNFKATIAERETNPNTGQYRSLLLPGISGFELVLRPRTSDSVVEDERQLLFRSALAAAVALVLVAGYFAYRDVVRELRTASLRSGFVTAVSHELKTPLTSIRLLAETLRLRRTSDPAAIDNMLHAIADEGERLSRLIDNILATSRIEKGAQQYDKRLLDVRDAVRTAVERFRWLSEQAGFAVNLDTAEQPLIAYADTDALIQAVSNLLDNALKYSGTSRNISVAVFKSAGGAEIRVVDRGIGIEPAHQSRIFQRFYRSPEASREAAGAGLGLALVQHFARAHRGRITLASRRGAGSTFSLWLPTVNDHGDCSDR